MLMSPSKFILQRIIKNRTINFETVKRTHNNLVFVATESNIELQKVLGSKLFRPQQMMCSFVPRVIKPMNRKPMRIIQKDIYSELKDKTGGKIKIGKLMTSSYNDRNLTYNIIPEYVETAAIARKVKGESKIYQDYMTKYFEDLIANKIEELGYEKNYLVFPLNQYIENFKQKVFTNISVIGPLILFLKTLRKKSINYSKYKDIERVFFVNTNANAMLVINLKTFEEKDFMDVFLKIMRLNNFNNGTDALVADVIEEEEELDPADADENTREAIKDILLNKFAKTLKADNLTDFEAADKDEKDLILSIDRRIDKHLADENNIERSIEEITSEVEKDTEIKIKALKFIETKKIADQKLAQLSRNLQREVEVLDSIEDLTTEIEVLEPETFEIDNVDSRVKTSTLSNMDDEYNVKQAPKDLKAIISSFSESVYLPLTVESFTKEDTSDDFNKVDTVSIKYKTDEGKTLSFSLDIPKIVDKRYFYLGGNKKVLTKQLFRLPIVKTKPERVEITTNFNKVTIERTNGKLSRKNAYLIKLLGDYKNNPTINIEYGTNVIENAEYTNDFEYEELSDSVTKIESPRFLLLLNRKDMEADISLLDIPEDYIKGNMTPLGFNKVSGNLIFIRDERIYSVTVSGTPVEELISNSLFNFIYEKVLGRTGADRLPNIGKSFIYTKMKIFGTTYPVFAVLGLLNGITDILRRYKVEYNVVDKKLLQNPSFVEVKFKDKYLYYKDTVRNTLLLNVLYMMDTENYDFLEFDLDQPYLDFFIQKLDQPIYIKNTLKINTNIIIDPITKGVLKDLKLPTNITDLLLLANTMLMNNAYRPQNDVRNYRVRGTEIVYAMMYQIIADAYIKYQRARLNGRDAASFDIPRNILLSRLLTEPNVNDHSTLNPVLEMESIAQISAKGFKGINLDDAFTLEVRAYDESMIGFISPNSTPQGNAGVARALSYNPKITSLRGYIPSVDRNMLEPSNILSPAEMLASFTSTQADPMRQSMQVGQTKHTMPVLKTHKQLIGSGINKTMAFMISDDFAFKAKDDGIIESIDEDTNIVILLYTSGKKDAIDLSEVFVKNSNSGFYIKQKFKMVYKEKEKFKKGDVIAYNPSFFSGKGKDIDYQPGVLAKVAITAGDFAFEDSTIISDSISKKAASLITMMKPVALGPNTIVHKVAKIGDKVSAGDHIIDFTTSFEDPSTTEFLMALSKSLGSDVSDSIGNEAVKSKYSGTIADIKIYYNKPLDELSESLQKLIKQYRAKVQKRKNILGDIKDSTVRIAPTEQQKSDSKGITKIGTDEFEGVMIQFFVEYYDEMAEGDKLVYSTALKGVISQRLADEEAPISEYRQDEHIEAILTPTGIISRMTADIYSMLFGNKVLVELGKQIKEIMEDKR